MLWNFTPWGLNFIARIRWLIEFFLAFFFLILFIISGQVIVIKLHEVDLTWRVFFTWSWWILPKTSTFQRTAESRSLAELEFSIDQRTLTYLVRGNITVCLTSCFTGLDSAVWLNWNYKQICLFGQFLTGQTGGISPYKVSERSLHRFSYYTYTTTWRKWDLSASRKKDRVVHIFGGREHC